MGVFDDVPDVPVARNAAPAAPARVPVSLDNLDRSKVPFDPSASAPGAPSVPVSLDNLDRSKIPAGAFDDVPDRTEAQRSNTRIQDIVGRLRKNETLAPGLLDIIPDAMSLGVTRPLSAGITTAIAKAKGTYPEASAGEIYKALIGYANDRNQRGDVNAGPLAPLVRGIASTPAAMMTGGGSGTVKALTSGTTAAPRVVGGVATNPLTASVRSSIPGGTIETAARAAPAGIIEGAARNADSVENAVSGGIQGGATSAVLAGGIDRGIKMLPAGRRAARAEKEANRGQTPEEIDDLMKPHYKMLDNNGVAYDHNQTNTLQSGLRTLRSNSVYVPGNHAGLDTAYNDLLEKAKLGQMSFNDLDNARSAIGTIGRDGNAATRRATGAINNEIDRMIGSGPPALNPNNIDVKTAYETARGLARRKALTQDATINTANVEQRIDQKPNVNPNQAMKDEYGKVEKQYRQKDAYDPHKYDPEGRELLANIVRGGPLQNKAAWWGDALSNKYAQFGAGSAGIAIPSLLGISQNVNPVIHAGLAGASGAAVGGAINMLGKGANRLAANLGEKNVAAYMRHLSDTPAPVPGAAIDRNDLAQIIFGQDFARTAPRSVAALVDKLDPPKKKKPIELDPITVEK